MHKKSCILVMFAMLLLAPLAGLVCRGIPPAFFAYPPLISTRPLHAPFSWVAFIGISLLCLLTAGVFLYPRAAGFTQNKRLCTVVPKRYPMPMWGWIGLILMMASWLLAWRILPIANSIRIHMFAPLWLGYVLVMDGLVFRRQGYSFINRTPAIFLMLFPASALSWWYFEYLNRFVQNWWYEGILQFGPWHYVIYGCLCFSTVFPAIFETQEWVCSFSRFQHTYEHGPTWNPLSRHITQLLFILGAVGLFVMGWHPDPFFYLTWLAPLLLLASGLHLAGIPTPFTQLKNGDYRMVFSLAIAALITGLFWEMWNYYSMPKWHYSIPYVDTAPVFEMPILGYAGYLPFGLICWCFWLAWRVLFLKREALEH